MANYKKPSKDTADQQNMNTAHCAFMVVCFKGNFFSLVFL